VIIGDLHVVGITASPAKANPPLIVDSDAVLILAISGELFEAVPGGHSEIAQRVSCVKQEELLQGRPVNTLWEPFRSFAIEDSLCLWIFEAPNHRIIIMLRVNNVKRYACVIF
jgi:hypothetical protein